VDNAAGHNGRRRALLARAATRAIGSGDQARKTMLDNEFRLKIIVYCDGFFGRTWRLGVRPSFIEHGVRLSDAEGDQARP
jgi:hypothetical protein